MACSSDRVVISNSIVERTDTSSDGLMRTWTFAVTPVMSTYLVALVIGEFDSVSAIAEKSGTLVTVYTPAGKAETGKFALEVGCKCLDLFQELFGCPYMGGLKCDMLAVPDFA